MIGTAFFSALKLICSGDPEFYWTILRSLLVSLTAVGLAGGLGITAGYILGLTRWPGKGILTRIIYVLMGLPPVLAGLLVFLLLSRSGPIGRNLYLLYTPTAMIIAQTLLAFPIITGLTMVAVEERAAPIVATARGLGADPWQTGYTLLKELRIPVIAGLVTAFGRVSAEVGAVMLVGGDIAGYTRVLTTAIVLETRKGNFETAIAFGLVLLILSFVINSALYFWQYRR